MRTSSQSAEDALPIIVRGPAGGPQGNGGVDTGEYDEELEAIDINQLKTQPSDYARNEEEKEMLDYDDSDQLKLPSDIALPIEPIHTYVDTAESKENASEDTVADEDVKLLRNSVVRAAGNGLAISLRDAGAPM